MTKRHTRLTASRARRVPTLLLLLTGMLTATGAAANPNSTQGGPGYLVVEAVFDSTARYVWDDSATEGRRILTWPEGSLTLPDTLATERYGRHDLGLPTLAGLSGSGASGRLALVDGIYPISEPLTLTDGRLELRVTAGELEIRGPQIRYRNRPPDLGDKDRKSAWLLVAGMVVLIAVLMRRARLKVAERSAP
jgi:hypothetical protein